MFFEILFGLFAGICVGIITGLTPGLHINMVCVLVLSYSVLLLSHFSIPVILSFIISLSITHTFLDSIPSIFLGAPNDSTALGVLPGHRYLLRGWGYMAVKLTVIGSFSALVISILLFPVLVPVVGWIYPFIENYIPYFLILIAVFMILRDRNILWATILFLLSGILGIVVFSIPNFKDPLFPLLSGLFGLSTLIYSLLDKQVIPPQDIKADIKLEKDKTFQAIFSGGFSGFITALLPGLSASIAAVMSLQITRKLGDHGFMILMGCIGVASFVFSLVTLIVVNKARNGSVIVIQKLVETPDNNLIVILLCVALISGVFAVFLTLFFGRVFSRMVSVVPYKLLVVSIICFLVLLVGIITGPMGLLVLLVSTAIGLIPAVLKITRTHSMGCLMLPVILYFLL